MGRYYFLEDEDIKKIKNIFLDIMANKNLHTDVYNMYYNLLVKLEQQPKTLENYKLKIKDDKYNAEEYVANEDMCKPFETAITYLKNENKICIAFEGDRKNIKNRYLMQLGLFTTDELKAILNKAHELFKEEQ